MKKIVVVLFLLMGTFLQAQSVDYNLKKGYAANGYDVVAYFDGKAKEGLKKFSTEYDGVKFKFHNQENLDKFKAMPNNYLPQYGGYCAYGVAVSETKVNVDPKTFEIRDNKLYLFYNSGNTNTLQLWQNESPDKLKAKADKNWKKLKNR